MKLSEFQERANQSDQVAGHDEKSKLVPLLGLAGEVGSLLSEYKKYLRDGGAHQRFNDQIAEDLGDLLWYISNVATKFGLDLEAVAAANLEKVRGRWPQRDDNQGTLFDHNQPHLLDEGFEPQQQFPRRFTITFEEIRDGQSAQVIIRRDDKQLGNVLTDNAYEDDGYRFHDAFHLAYAAVLGWSPIIRSLLGVKRKADQQIDEVEDGARAKIIEELISQLVYTYAREHNYLDGVGSVDYHLLKTVQSLVADREVKVRSLADWERAIFAGYGVWRELRVHRGGVVDVNLLARQLTYRTIE